MTSSFGVVEIKGVNGSAAEKHAAQLEKWVSSYYEENAIKPKGILIVNAYKEKALKDRPTDTFPHQMLNYSQQREHCLLSSIQLLGLYYEFKSNPDKKEELIDKLLSHVGVFPDFKDWKLFLSVEPTES